jgi:hypothetical protein
MVLTPDQPFPKTRGHVIRSKDWNDAIVEVQRLDTAKVNKSGDTITGSLTVGSSLNVGTTTAGSRLELGGNADLVLRATAEDAGDIVFQNSAGTQKGRVWSNQTAGAALFLSSGDITPDLTIDTSGNVGIGTTTPASGNKLDVAGSLRILTGSNPVRFTSAHTGFSNSVTNQAEISNDTGTFRSLMIVGNRSGSLPGPGLGRRVSVYDTLEVNGTLRMAIQGDILFKGGLDANHGIGWYGGAKGDRDSYDLGFAGTTVDGPVVYGFNGGALGSTSGGQRIALTWNSGRVVRLPGALEVVGTASKTGGGQWSVLSDERLKKGVRSLDSALDRLSRLRGVSFEWKEPEKQGELTGTQIGLVAQEVEEVFPEWVDTDHNGYKMLTVRGFEALTVEALKELVAENETLQAKNNDLEGRIKDLELSAFAKDRETDATEAAERSAGNSANGSPT